MLRLRFDKGREAMRGLASSLMLMCALAAADASAGVLDRTRETGVFKIGYRTDAAPLSYQNDIGEPDGYSLDLCRVVASAVRQAAGVDKIAVQYVPVGTADRFDALRDGRIDILCGSTSVTLDRRKQIDFSLVTFVDGASVLFREDGPHTFEELENHKVGVRARTTTERTLRRTLNELSVGAEVVPLRDHADGLNQLESGELAAYFADRAILSNLLARSAIGNELRLSERFYTFERIALGLPLGDSEFRWVVDSALSELFRSDRILALFRAAFGVEVRPSDILKTLFILNSLPN